MEPTNEASYTQRHHPPWHRAAVTLLLGAIVIEMVYSELQFPYRLTSCDSSHGTSRVGGCEVVVGGREWIDTLLTEVHGGH